MRGLGLVATTNSEGAGKWSADLNPHLAGRTCYVMEDNDEPGAAHVRKVAEHLAGVAAEVRIVKLPGLAPKGDVGDWIAAGGEAATLLDLCRAAPVYDPGAAENAEPARQAKRRDANDTRPVVTMLAGQIKDAVDAVEAALIRRGGLFSAPTRSCSLGRGAGHHRRQAGGQRVRIFERGEHALAEDIAEAACLMKWDGRAEDYVVTNPPSWLVRTLQQRTGAFRFPILTAVINAPTLRPDGSLLATPGYDKATGLYYDPRGVDFPAIPTRPTKADADRALADLGDLISGFPFDGRPTTPSPCPAS